MYLIQPDVTILDKGDLSVAQHIARCARVCYGKEDKITDHESSVAFVKEKREAGHVSILRHGSYYFIINKEFVGEKLYRSYNQKLKYYKKCPYIQIKGSSKALFISTNAQFIYDNPDLLDLVGVYEVCEELFKIHCPFKDMFRYTLMITTQISTSRELNRTSPNAISEMSTRYINFGRRKGITICEPHYYKDLPNYKKFLCRIGWRIDEFKYYQRLKWNLPKQDARGELPLDAATVCIYTYSIAEWKHILDLRYFEKTGKAHPNAKIIGSMIYHTLSEVVDSAWLK